MTLYIFNRQDGSQSADFYQNEITEDILWSGNSWQQFKNETGLNQSHIGGIVMLDGKLSFSQDKFDEMEKLKLPLASGKSLISFIESYFSTKPDERTERDHWKLRKQLQSLFVSSGISNTLNSETCNPILSQADFQNVLLDIEDLLSEKVIDQNTRDLMVSLANGWLNTVRF